MIKDDLERFEIIGEKVAKKDLPNATAVLVLGIMSIVGCCFYGLPGLIMGIIALVLHKKDKEVYGANPMVYSDSYKNSNAGYVCAIIGVILSVLFMLFLIPYVTVMVAALLKGMSAAPIRY